MLLDLTPGVIDLQRRMRPLVSFSQPQLFACARMKGFGFGNYAASGKPNQLDRKLRIRAHYQGIEKLILFVEKTALSPNPFRSI